MGTRASPHLFLILFWHAELGPQMAAVRVKAERGKRWSTEWHIGTIDKDPMLSDRWFCQERYRQKFWQLLQAALDKAGLGYFDLPLATFRWGAAHRMKHDNAVDLAAKMAALWEQILIDWNQRFSDRPTAPPT